MTSNQATDRYNETVTDVRQTARQQVVPARTPGLHGQVDHKLLAALASSGLLPRIFPRAMGGSAPELPSARELCAIREGLAAESAAAETAFALQGLGSYPLLLAGGRELQERWIPAVARGEAVAAFALTEPNAGSDAAALSLRAAAQDDDFILTGTKVWISNAPEADLYTVFARTTEQAGSRGVTAFAVRGDSPGLAGTALDITGGHPIGRLEFDGVRVPRGSVLGEVDRGFRVAMSTLNRFRPSVGAGAVGMAQTALECASAHAQSRHAFGQPIAAFQAVSHQIADMAVRIAAARLMVIEAAVAHDTGSESMTVQAAMAKVFATESAQFVVDAAIQVLGAQGLERGHLLAELYQEIRALRIYEGTSEIQRGIISRQILS